MRKHYLIAAANVEVRQGLGRAMRGRGAEVTLCGSGTEALELCRSTHVDAAVIDEHLPDLPAERVRAQMLTQHPECRVVVVTSFFRVRGTPEQLKFGRDHFILEADQILEMVESSANGRGRTEAGGASVTAVDALIKTLDVLVGLLEVDDRHFGGTSHQAARLARSIAERLRGDRNAVREIVLATLLRDIGRAGVPDKLFAKRGALSGQQREAMKSHVDNSLRLLEHIQFPWKVLPIIRHHHERYDGTGYPDGLRGREIPLGARIVGVVDAYVAMTSPRSHREPLSPELALDELMRESGHQFDPEVVEALQAVVDDRLDVGRTDHGRTVLVADADAEFRKLLKLRLVNEGYLVQETDSSSGALEGVIRHDPQLVLLDIDDDSEATFDMLEKLRGKGALDQVACIVMSKRDDRVLKLRALRHGVDDYLDKRADLEELVARVSNVVVREAVRRGTAVTPARRGISGQLENLALPDIVQMLVIGVKTASVTLRDGEREGRIWFEDGAPRRAENGKLRGEDAFYDLVTWKQGQFLIEHGVHSESTNLEGDAMLLLMEGLRRLDETNEAATT